MEFLPFISHAAPLATFSSSFRLLSHRFHPPLLPRPGQPLYPSRYVSPPVAAVQRCIPSTAFRSGCFGRMRRLIAAIRGRCSSLVPERSTSAATQPEYFRAVNFPTDCTYTNVLITLERSSRRALLTERRNRNRTRNLLVDLSIEGSVWSTTTYFVTRNFHSPLEEVESSIQHGPISTKKAISPGSLRSRPSAIPREPVVNQS